MKIRAQFHLYSQAIYALFCADFTETQLLLDVTWRLSTLNLIKNGQ